MSTIGDVTYAGLLKIVRGFTTDETCATHVMQLTSYFPKVDQLELIVVDSQEIARSKLQHLPAGVTRLSDDEALAVVLFTYDLGLNSDDPDGADNFFVQLNELLRLREPATVRAIRPYLFFLFSALDKLPQHTGTVYRGIPASGLEIIQNRYHVGTEIWWSAFTSTTTNLNTAKSFAEGPGGIVFRITLTDGRRIQDYSAISREDEILLRPNTKFMVSQACHPVTEGALAGFFCVDLVQAAGRFIF